jgi:uncharacterized protein (UPF0262 family)
MDIADEQGNALETLMLGLGRFRRPIREYFAICESYYQAIRKATAQEIETIDMARRGLHDTKRPNCCSNGSKARWRPTSPRRGGCSR